MGIRDATLREERFRNRYINLKNKLKQKGWDVREVDNRTLRDYLGMNPYAATMMSFNKCKPREFLIDNSISYEKKFETLVHEVNETRMMQNGTDYWEAHKEALRDERTLGGIPW